MSGWLDWLYTAVAWVIMRIHDGLSYVFPENSGWNWGLSIFLLTILVRILIFPLFMKQIHASRKMQELSPKVMEIRKKYKNDKQRQQQETMKLYQENGANPLGGCLPLIAQFPIFISLFTVLRTIAEGKTNYGLTEQVISSAREAKLFGVGVGSRFLAPNSELLAHGVNPTTARIVIGVMVIISGTTTFLTMRQSISRSIAAMPDNPMARQQKFLMYLSPLFALFSLGFPVGVIIYWVTSNLWTLAQQHFVYRKYPQTPPGGGGGGNGAKPTGSGGGGGTGARKTPPSSPPEVEAPPKIVRQQPVRQPRSKRSGGKR